METVAFFDIAVHWTGWTIGAGDVTPTAGAFELQVPPDDLGALAHEFAEHLDILHARFSFTFAGYESPILVVGKKNPDGSTRTDKLEDLRRIYGLGMQLEAWCRRKGILYGEVSAQRIKKEVTGNRFAKKEQVADIIEHRLGITLPATKAQGRLDAGDAGGGWLIGIRDHNPAIYDRWAAKLWGRRGNLL